MSWETINEMLILASVDPDFCKELLDNALNAARGHGFKLTLEEQKILQDIHAHDIYELSQILVRQLGPASS